MLRATALATLPLLNALPAAAHFQVLFGGDSNIGGGRAIDALLAFAHPAAGDPLMDMGEPEAFYVIRQSGDQEPQRTDLKQYLSPIQFTGPESAAAAYRARIPGSVTRGLGDYVFVLEPAPYFEGEEDKYIKQYTKVIFNVGGVPGNWAEPVGTEVEILPLDKPYGVWAGGIFRGVVLAGGEPVPFAEVEVEYLNYVPDLSTNSWGGEPGIKAPFAVMENLSSRADANGTIIVALPKAGWWGIGALDLLPDSTHEGKHLSKDAVIWVEAIALPD